jgi:hypothetical protein
MSSSILLSRKSWEHLSSCRSDGLQLVIPILVGLWRKKLCLRNKFNKNEVGSMASEA